MAEVNIGDIVRAHYNSGTYIGEVIEDRGERYLIEVLAVYKHPLQGDIHNPGQVEGVFFHERKALAHHEKMNVKKPAVHLYNEEIPEYGPSLKQAVQVYREKLQEKESDFNQAALQKLEGLEENIYKKSYY
ncbi:sporulation phosphorelay system protein KapB [Virgibacillus sp. YIM 98842]|jgi:kinase-associated protein B|uniref:sporulation phosphorelay system protein KapB n=1 Tax=Virgibacillus sp. YIM 98842 TaxID=2663533 RepID=UPI0013D90EA3|nr:sporulation phosphorelay system protein KapB [Virgibacillus sp. YIM 98842]